jgi:lysyl-tRNA synthetase class 1
LRWSSIGRGKVIAKELYRIEPPVPHIYEFILINGEKMASRRGNVFIAREILDIIEPEIFTYFYTKRSLKQRNMDLKNIYLLVEEFEKMERIFFGVEDEPNKKEKINIMRMYESAMKEIPEKLPLRIPYQFASVVAQTTTSLDHAIDVLRTTGHIKGKLTEEDKDNIRDRLNLAKNWVDRFATHRKIVLHESIPEKIMQKLTPMQKQALSDLAMFIRDKPTMTEKELDNKFYEIIKFHNMKPTEFFTAAYLALIGKPHGPKLAQFIAAVGEKKVMQILKKI